MRNKPLDKTFDNFLSLKIFRNITGISIDRTPYDLYILLTYLKQIVFEKIGLLGKTSTFL